VALDAIIAADDAEEAAAAAPPPVIQPVVPPVAVVEEATMIAHQKHWFPCREVGYSINRAIPYCDWGLRVPTGETISCVKSNLERTRSEILKFIGVLILCTK
jgi:hypothetical protein